MIKTNFMKLLTNVIIVLLCTCFYNCKNDTASETSTNNRGQSQVNDTGNVKFKQINAQKSGIDFVNRVDELSTKINYFTYLYLYN